MSGSLGDDYPKQQARLRVLRAVAADLPIQSAWFYIAQLDSLLQRAEAAAISGDIVQMIAVYNEMKEFES